MAEVDMDPVNFVYSDIVVKHNFAKKYLYIQFPEPNKATPLEGPGELAVPTEPLLLINIRLIGESAQWLFTVIGETLMGTEFVVMSRNRIDDENNEITYLIVYARGGTQPVAGGKFSLLDFQKGEAEIPEPLDQYLDNTWDHLYKDFSGNGNTHS